MARPNLNKFRGNQFKDTLKSNLHASADKSTTQRPTYHPKDERRTSLDDYAIHAVRNYNSDAKTPLN